MLEREQAVFRDALRRLKGKTEWGVKLIAEPGALEQALAEDESEETDEVSPGVAYMQSRGREAREREEIDALANSWAAEAHERLAEAAVEALLNPLQNPEVSGHVGEMLLNGVYLVEDAGMDAFTAEVEALVVCVRRAGRLRGDDRPVAALQLREGLDRGGAMSGRDEALRRKRRRRTSGGTESWQRRARGVTRHRSETARTSTARDARGRHRWWTSLTGCSTAGS